MKVLLAVDGSPYTEMCVQAIRMIGLPPGSPVTIMTVIPEHTFLGGLHLDTLVAGRRGKSELHQAQQEAAQALLEKTRGLLGDTPYEVDTHIARGKPAEQIIAQAHKLKAGLLVIGVKGLTDFDSFVIGNVASRVIKHVGCSVLLVKERVSRMRRIMLATDGTRYAEAAASFLLELNLPERTQIFVITALQSHVAALLKMPTLNLETNRQILAELQKAEEKEARKLLDRVEKDFESRGYDVTPLMRKGEPAQEIINCSTTFNPDLIAVGAKGHSGIESFLLGSVAHKIARVSRYSVLIVRPFKS